MFGTHAIPLNIQEEEFSISIESEDDFYNYKRETGREKKEKIVLGEQKQIIINPVEPLNYPKDLSPYLEIEFGRTLAVKPSSIRKIFLKFPLEIGVFLFEKKAFEVLDIFSLTRPKFTLYGDPRNGVICKYWKSDVFSSVPPVDYFHEGVIELTVYNTSQEWEEVSRAVFNAFGMKIYYSDSIVAMKAEMKVMSQSSAETAFFKSPLTKGMKKALELYVARKIPITTTRFIMREGL
jgi:hypothetical protein